MTGALFSAKFSPDGKRVVLAGDYGRVEVWDVATERKLLHLDGHTDEVMDAEYSPDGTAIATAGADGTARVWRAEDGVLLNTIGSPTDDREWVGASWSPGGSWLMLAAVNLGVAIWSRSNLHRADGRANVLHDITGLSSARVGQGTNTYTVAAAVGADVKLLRFFRPSMSSSQFAVEDAGVLAGHEGHVNAAEFSTGGSLLVSAATDGTARVWRTGELWHTLDHGGEELKMAAFSPISDYRVATATIDGHVWVWDLDGSGRPFRRFAGPGGEIHSVRFSRDPDSGTNWVLTANQDGSAWITNVYTTEHVKSFGP